MPRAQGDRIFIPSSTSAAQDVMHVRGRIDTQTLAAHTPVLNKGVIALEVGFAGHPGTRHPLFEIDQLAVCLSSFSVKQRREYG